MRIQSDAEIQDFLGIVNNQQFNSMCIRITTELTPPTVKVDGEIESPPEGAVDAELERHSK